MESGTAQWYNKPLVQAGYNFVENQDKTKRLGFKIRKIYPASRQFRGWLSVGDSPTSLVPSSSVANFQYETPETERLGTRLGHSSY